MDFARFDYNAAISACFKTTPTGRNLFFPWGVFGRGYAFASRRDYERVRAQIIAYLMVFLTLSFAAFAVRWYLAVIVAAVLLSFYLVWQQRLLRRLEPTNERLSLRESITAQALAHKGWRLWLLESIALTFVALGVVIVVADPSDWPLAVFSITFFGLGAVYFAQMLVLRRQYRRAAQRRLLEMQKPSTGSL
jgi:hypothetical protein